MVDLKVVLKQLKINNFEYLLYQENIYISL